MIAHTHSRRLEQPGQAEKNVAETPEWPISGNGRINPIVRKFDSSSVIGKVRDSDTRVRTR
jgi:hypothetical protein